MPQRTEGFGILMITTPYTIVTHSINNHWTFVYQALRTANLSTEMFKKVTRIIQNKFLKAYKSSIFVFDEGFLIVKLYLNIRTCDVLVITITSKKKNLDHETSK